MFVFEAKGALHLRPKTEYGNMFDPDPVMSQPLTQEKFIKIKVSYASSNVELKFEGNPCSHLLQLPNYDK